MTRRWTSGAVVLTASFLALTACGSPAADDYRTTDTDPVSGTGGYSGGGRPAAPMVLPATSSPATRAPGVAKPTRTAARPTRTVAPAQTRRTVAPTVAAQPASTVKTKIVGSGGGTGSVGG
ncbi:hypothetical protein [Actinoplanes palleronii]|uniref:hypothetical protein n=1 Tax=Actinoplanes palleronii TaxID=113570 RepID=UPI00194494CA|nr:hypothetical protein [Actinoplanes palleronii]